MQANGFRYYFTPLTGVLFNFPSRYWFTIGHERVFSLGPWSGQIPTRFHVSRGTRVLQAPSQLTFVYRTYHLLWWAVPGPSTSDLVFYLARAPNCPPLQPHNPRFATRSGLTQIAFRLFPVRSPLLRESLSFSFSSGYLDVSILRVSLLEPFGPRFRRMNGRGLPHSEILGSKPVCGSPRLIAAYHVLHRLLVPSHPPLALGRLTTEFSSACPSSTL